MQISFVVDENGKVGHISILQGVCDELDNIVSNLVQKSPDWQPATKGGQAVAVRLIQPVVFGIRGPQKEEGSENSIMNVTTAASLPRFNGGSTQVFDEWVRANISYPAKAAANNIQGRVVLSFIISETGEVKDVKVIEGLDEELDAEAVRVVSSSPKWTPAMKQGKPIATELLYTVTFTSESQTRAVILNVRADGSVESGGKVMQLKDMASYLQSLDMQPAVSCIQIKADANTRMGYIHDLKDVLREVGALKVQYVKPSENTSVSRRLPPSPKMPGVVSFDEAMSKIDHKDVCVVRINSADRVYFEKGAYDQDADMLRIGKAFLKKRGRNTCFSFVYDRGTSYGAYQHMEELLVQIYAEVRDEKAHEVYGKAISELSEEELQNIYKMVPMNIVEASPKG